MADIIGMDGILRISLMQGEARAFLADSTRMCEKARQTHHLSRVASAALGRLLTGASMMGLMLKSESDSLTVQIKGGGPLGTLLAVARPDGTVKGYVDQPHVDIARRADGKLDVGAAVGADGELAVIKDMGRGEPYVGRVKLETGEIAEDLAMYFTASEQTPSLVSLGVLVGERVISAGGLIIQPMPGCSEAALKSIELSVPMFENLSGTLHELGLNGALWDLLGHLEPEVIGTARPEYHCDCTRGRMERALISLGVNELTALIDEQRGAELTCHFCTTRHRFSERQLRGLLDEAQNR